MSEQDKPPPKSSPNNLELCVPCGWDIRRLVFGCQPLLASNNSFRSLVMLSGGRRTGFLATNRKDR